MSAVQPAPGLTPFIPEWTLGDRMRKAREVANLSQSDVSKELGVSQSIVSKWEAGDRNPPIDMIRRYSLLANVDAFWLMGIEDVSDLDEYQGDSASTSRYPRSWVRHRHLAVVA